MKHASMKPSIRLTLASSTSKADDGTYAPFRLLVSRFYGDVPACHGDIPAWACRTMTSQWTPRHAVARPTSAGVRRVLPMGSDRDAGRGSSCAGLARGHELRSARQ